MAREKIVHQARRVISLSRRTKSAIKNRLSIKREFSFNIDSPRKSLVEKRVVEVEGWIFSKQNKKFSLRIKNNDKVYSLKTGIKRIDVTKTHPTIDKKYTLHSGFYNEFEFEDGTLSLEVDLGRGFKELYKTEIAYGTGELPRDIYNKDLSNNYPEHVNLLQNRQQFYYEDKLQGSYKRHKKDTRLVAIYLPQFHPFELNNNAWGEGFTEWTNVTTAQPRFIGHQQPILPKDLGFYDLRLDSKIKEQIDLAKKYGVYGFSFYYYWFSGKKIMEKPLESFLDHKEWDFNFSICWANENWTKRWDGRNNDIIIAQEYKDDDPLQFIKDVEEILLDPRYITEDGKPVLSVYRASELKDPKRYTDVWRNYFREKHGKELQLVSYISFEDTDPREYGFDAALDFAPLSAFFKNKLFKNSQFPYIDVSQKLLDINFSGVVADYGSIALNEKLDTAFDFPTYLCVTPSWDNDARKKGKGFIYQNSSPDLYAHWLDRVIKKSLKKDDSPLVFVNAWNEWAEGAIMEPSVHLGHAVLNRTVEVLAKNSKNKENSDSFPLHGIHNRTKKKLAVVVHLFYEDLWDEIAAHLNLIDAPFDLFVSLGKHNQDFKPVLDNKNTKIHTFVLPNRGRDVLPFMFMARRVKEAGYEYVLKMHSKKSKWRDDGSSWFGDVLNGLLPDKHTIEKVIEQLDQKDTGIIGPEGHVVSLKRHMGSNKLSLKDLLVRAYGEKEMKQVMRDTAMYPYIGGTMFWARVDALDSLTNLQLTPDDFPSEQGQIDGTISHAIERFIGVASKLDKKGMYTIKPGTVSKIADHAYDEKYKFAP
jgi:lipopolysaccharide biosynthesis protein